MSQYDYIIYMGRFAPLHIGHAATITKALEVANNVIILCGSAYQPRTPKNPFTVEERWAMIKSIPNIPANKLFFTFLYDYYNDQKWAAEVQKKVKEITYNKKADKIGIIGCKKDSSSYYLDMFPQWEFIEMKHIDLINATDIRSLLFEKGNLINVPQTVGDFLYNFMSTDIYAHLKEEHKVIEDYKKSWKVAPYAPIFVTVDAVVVQSGHVLMVTRGAAPGKGLLALPGGFINQEERLLDAMVRELKEETKLKVPVPVIKGSIRYIETFDSPYRSQRGRTITHAYLIELPNGELHKIKGSDDAIHATWIPLTEVESLREQIFEDHFNIIETMIDKL